MNRKWLKLLYDIDVCTGSEKDLQIDWFHQFPGKIDLKHSQNRQKKVQIILGYTVKF